LLATYGKDLVLLDATYRTTKYDIPLFFLVVLSNVGYQLVGTFMVGRENSDEISRALKVIGKWNPSWIPQAVMCDLDQREINAFEAVFKGNYE